MLKSECDLDDIVATAIEQFHLKPDPIRKPDGDIDTVEKLHKRVRRKIRLRLDDMTHYDGKSFWEAAKRYVPDRKSPLHLFSEKQMLEILNDDNLHDYLVRNSASEEIRSRPKRESLREKIVQYREAAIQDNEELMEAFAQGKLYPDDYYSDEPYHITLNQHMIDAIFQQFYPRINREHFIRDSNTVRAEFINELDLSTEEMAIIEKLKNPSNYCEARDGWESLVDKIAAKVISGLVPIIETILEDAMSSRVSETSTAEPEISTASSAMPDYKELLGRSTFKD